MSVIASAKKFVAKKWVAVLSVLAALTAWGVPVASAIQYDIFNSTSLVIAEVTKLMAPILAVIVAAVPLIITLAVIGFVLGLLAAILSRLNL